MWLRPEGPHVQVPRWPLWDGALYGQYEPICKVYGMWKTRARQLVSWNVRLLTGELMAVHCANCLVILDEDPELLPLPELEDD